VDLYTFTVEDFIIHDTRAVHNDTLQLSLSAHVDGDVVASRVISIGDCDNGEYSTVDFVPSDVGPGLGPVVINDPTSKVAFNFQLVNGSLPAGTLSGSFAAAADKLASMGAGVAGADAAALATGPTGLLLIGLSELWSWLSVDCDGPVAVDQISGPRYVLDAWTDNSAESVRMQKRYPGSDSPMGCGGNSDYEVIWSLQHSRAWVDVKDQSGSQLISEGGVSAAEHNGAVHAFGVGGGGGVTHARTFAGASWTVDDLGPFDLGNLPVSAVSFDDRLYVFGVHADGSISSLAYTVDGGSWVTRAKGPGGLETAEPIATAVFRHRLYVIASDSVSGQLRVTSTSDLGAWDLWTDVPSLGMPPASAVAAAALGDTLFIFRVYKSGKTPDAVIMRNSTSDGVTWSGWTTVEGGSPLEGAPADEPLDVAAGVFQERIYLATRWESTNNELYLTDYIAVNFTEDGNDWSGWRRYGDEYQATASAGLAAVGNHLYILSTKLEPHIGETTHVWVY
jgi:hypothetical protein